MFLYWYLKDTTIVYTWTSLKSGSLNILYDYQDKTLNGQIIKVQRLVKSSNFKADRL